MMETKRKRNIDTIIDMLSIYKHTISMRGSINLHDINISAEDFVCELLNRVYGYQLKNLNRERTNNPGIDLGDTVNGIAVQVTSDNRREKVKETLNTFAEYGYIEQYSRLIVFILGDKKRFTASFESAPLRFSVEKDILDFKDIVKAINTLDTDKIESVCSYVEQELTCGSLEIQHSQTDRPQMNGESPEDDSFKEFDSTMSQETERIYTKIQKLKRRFGLNKLQIDRIENALNDICRSKQDVCLGKGIIEKHDEELCLFKKAFFFIQSMDRYELEFLNDIGIRINIQVVMGDAQREIEHFFELYEMPEDWETAIRDYGIGCFNQYTFEQFFRLLSSYEKILYFDPNTLGFSTGYSCKKGNIGKVLAVSATGKASKIYIWDINARKNQPVAVLAGLFESVRDVKVFRVNGHIYVSARGKKRIYIWSLNTDKYFPISIFCTNSFIDSYSLYRSKNNKLHIVADSNRKLYFWELGSNDEYCFSVRANIQHGDAYIINTQIELGKPTYYILGNSASASNINNSIYLLKEGSQFEFEIEHLCDGKELCSDTQSLFRTQYSIDSYQIAPNQPILGVLTRRSLFLYDIQKKKKIFSLAQKGQQIFDFRMMSDDNGDIYLLIYYLFIRGNDDGRGLVRCYCVRNGKIIDERECFRADVDIRRAVITREKDDILVFFNKYDDNVIFTTSYDEMNDYREFYTLPDSMFVVDMVIE